MLGADRREARRIPKHQPFLEWFSADPPVDARGRPTGGAPHSQTPTRSGEFFFRPAPSSPAHHPRVGGCFGPPPPRAAGRRRGGGAPLPNANPFWGVFVAGPPADARGRPTGGAPHLQTPTLLRIAFLPTHPLALDADQGEAARGAAHRGMLRHLANNSSLAFCMRSAASVSLRSLDCRASRSDRMPTKGRRRVVRLIAACSGIWPTIPVWPSACAVPLRYRCVLWTAAPADPRLSRASSIPSTSSATPIFRRECGSRSPGSGVCACLVDRWPPWQIRTADDNSDKG